MRMVKIAQVNCERLVRLVNDLLETQAMDAGRRTIDLERLDVRTHVEETIACLKDYASSLGVSVRVDAGAQNGLVLADSGALIEIVTNLVSNAIKFSPRNAEVVVGIEKRDAGVCISVRDHGPGIPEAYKDKIFDKFFQINAGDNRQTGGTGLGLSITRKLVVMFNGQITHEPAPGGGAIFNVILPRYDDASLRSSA